MDQTKAIRILALTEKLDRINGQIRGLRAKKMPENTILRKQFYETEAEIKTLMSDLNIIDGIFDEKTRDILRKIRDCEYLLSKESKRLLALLDKYGDGFCQYLEEKHGITVSEEEVDQEYSRREESFLDEIFDKIDPSEYLHRKRDFGTIITSKKVHEVIHDYFPEIRDCYLFGQFNAVIGLCRVLIERAFKDKAKVIEESKPDNVRKLIERLNLFDLIEHVSDELDSKKFKSNAHSLRQLSNKILHGEKKSHKLDAPNTLDFVKNTYIIIEELYS